MRGAKGRSGDFMTTYSSQFSIQRLWIIFAATMAIGSQKLAA
jgi:hypothetical protein